MYEAQEGDVLWKGESLMGLKPNQTAERGIARTFQNIALFPHMTVIENLLTGRHVRMRTSWLAGSIWLGKAKREEIENREIVEDIIDFLEIEQWRKYPVGLLPYGIQKRVELGRALAMDPELLMLDEPVAGMNLEETEDMARFILDVQDELGIAIILVEHDMGLVMDIADRVLVVDFGKPIAEGTPADRPKEPQRSQGIPGRRGGDGYLSGYGLGYSPTSLQAPGSRRPAAEALMMSPRMKGTTPTTTASVKLMSRRTIRPATPNA